MDVSGLFQAHSQRQQVRKSTALRKFWTRIARIISTTTARLSRLHRSILRILVGPASRLYLCADATSDMEDAERLDGVRLGMTPANPSWLERPFTPTRPVKNNQTPPAMRVQVLRSPIRLHILLQTPGETNLASLQIWSTTCSGVVLSHAGAVRE